MKCKLFLTVLAPFLLTFCITNENTLAKNVTDKKHQQLIKDGLETHLTEMILIYTNLSLANAFNSKKTKSSSLKDQIENQIKTLCRRHRRSSISSSCKGFLNSIKAYAQEANETDPARQPSSVSHSPTTQASFLNESNGPGRYQLTVPTSPAVSQ